MASFLDGSQSPQYGINTKGVPLVFLNFKSDFGQKRVSPSTEGQTCLVNLKLLNHKYSHKHIWISLYYKYEEILTFRLRILLNSIQVSLRSIQWQCLSPEKNHPHILWKDYNLLFNPNCFVWQYKFKSFLENDSTILSFSIRLF